MRVVPPDEDAYVSRLGAEANVDGPIVAQRRRENLRRRSPPPGAATPGLGWLVRYCITQGSGRGYRWKGCV